MSFGPPKGKYVRAKRAPAVEAEEEETGFGGYKAEWSRKAQAARRKFMSSVAARRAENWNPWCARGLSPSDPFGRATSRHGRILRSVDARFLGTLAEDIAIFSRRPSPPRPGTTRRPRSYRFGPV